MCGRAGSPGVLGPEGLGVGVGDEQEHQTSGSPQIPGSSSFFMFGPQLGCSHGERG